MAQIPTYNQSQRLEPSSPVAATSAENSAGYIQGGAIEAFGNAIFNTGNMLDRIGKANKDKIGELQVQIQSEKYKQRVQTLDATRRTEPVIENDPGGGVAAVSFVEGIKEQQEAFGVMFNDDPELKLRFELETAQEVTRAGHVAYADELAKREKIIPVLNKNLLQIYSDTAFNDPNKAEEARAKSEILIRSNKNIAPKDIEILVLEQNEAMTASGALGIVQRAKETNVGNPIRARNEFQRARKFVEINLNNLSDEKRDKLLNTIDTEEKQFSDIAYSTNQRIEAAGDKHTKKVRETTMAMYTQQLEAAGNDDNLVSDIMKSAANDENIKGDDLKSLPGVSNIFKDSKDDKFQGDYITKLINDKNPDLRKYNAKLNTAVDDGSLSRDRANKLQKLNDDIAAKKIPNLSNVISETEAYIKESYKTTQINPLTGMSEKTITVQGMREAQKFQAAISRSMISNPQLGPDGVLAIGNKYVQSGTPNSVKGLSPTMTINPQVIDQTLTQAELQFKRGGMTVKEKQQLLNKVEGLKKEKARQQLDMGYRIKQPEIFKNTPLRSVDE